MKRAFKNPNYNGMKSGIVVQRGEEIIQKEGDFASIHQKRPGRLVQSLP